MANKFEHRDQATFYDDFWRTHQIPANANEIERLARILLQVSSVRRMTSKSTFKICDLGCGRGWLSHELSGFGTVTGVDLSPKGIALAGERYPDVKFECADILNYRPSNTFDLVVTSEVIEHTENHSRFLETVEHILAPGGFLILTTPNKHLWTAWVRDNHSVRQSIENWLTPKDLRKLIGRYLIELHYETFHLYFSYKWPGRVLYAPKILRLMHRLQLLEIYSAINCSIGRGLFQLVLARKKELAG